MLTEKNVAEYWRGTLGLFIYQIQGKKETKNQKLKIGRKVQGKLARKSEVRQKQRKVSSLENSGGPCVIPVARQGRRLGEIPVTVSNVKCNFAQKQN